MADRGSSYRVFRPEEWSDYVRVFFRTKLAAAPHFMDFSDDVSGGGEMITIPHVAEGPTPTALTTTTGVITENVISDTRTQLTINSWVANAMRFTDYQMAQIAAKYNLQAEYAKMMAYGVSKNFDTCLIQTVQSGLITRAVTSSITAISATNIRDALQIIDSYSVPQADCIMITHPKHYWSLMRNQQLYNASVYGRGAPLAEGGMDRIFGIPVIITTNIPDTSTGLKPVSIIHKRAVAYAVGAIPGMGKSGPRLQYMKSSEGLYHKLIADLMFGVKILDSTAGCKINKYTANA